MSWGRRKDNNQPYIKTGRSGVKSSKTNPVSDVHMKEVILGEEIRFEKPFEAIDIQRTPMYEEQKNSVTYHDEKFQSKDGREIRLHIKSSGDFDYMDISMAGNAPIHIQLEPRGSQSFISEKMREQLARTTIEDNDDLYLFGKHFDDLIGGWYSDIMTVLRSDKNKAFSQSSIAEITGLDKQDVDGVIEMLKARGWIKKEGNGWKYDFSTGK